MCKELFIFKLTEHFKSHTLFINNIIFDFIFIYLFLLGGGLNPVFTMHHYDCPSQLLYQKIHQTTTSYKVTWRSVFARAVSVDFPPPTCSPLPLMSACFAEIKIGYPKIPCSWFTSNPWKLILLASARTTLLVSLLLRVRCLLMFEIMQCLSYF